VTGVDGARVCRASDLPPGERRIVEIDGISVGVFNVGGRYYALRNRCPHKAAPLCQGRIMGLITAPAPGEFAYSRDGEIIRCPWHGWEFDLTTGQSVFNPHRMKARAYPVTVESDQPDESVPTFDTAVHDGWVTVDLHHRTRP